MNNNNNKNTNNNNNNNEISSMLSSLIKEKKNSKKNINIPKQKNKIKLIKTKKNNKNINNKNNNNSRITSIVNNNMDTNLTSEMNNNIDTNLTSGVNNNIDTNLTSGVNNNMDTNLTSGVNNNMDTNLTSGVNNNMDTNLTSEMNNNMDTNLTSEMNNNIDTNLTSGVNNNIDFNYTNDLETKYNDTTDTINTITTELKNTNTNTNTNNTINNMQMKMSPEEFKNLIETIQDYLKLDKTYLIKHNELKNLYTTYNNSYTNNKNNINNINNTISETQHKEILKNIHSEMNDNNSHLFNGRLIILKKIKDEDKIEPVIKNKLCGHLLAIFKRPPNSEYQQLPMLSQSNETIAIDELDNAYLQKHNELMIVYKAYQKLFNKVLNYKSELEQYKKLPTRSSISRNHMNKLVSDQSFVMNMIDKMQDQLIDNKVMDNSDKIPVHPVTSHPKNIDTFNDTMKKQITTIVDSQSPVKPKLRTSIDKVLTKYRDCTESNALCCKSDYEKQKKCLDGTCKR